MKKYLAELIISIKYEDFTLDPKEIKTLLIKNLEYLISRGGLTEEANLVVEEHEVSVENKVEGKILRSDLKVNIHYEGDSSVEEIKSILKGLADEMAGRGYFTDHDLVVDDYSISVSAKEK